LIVLFDESKNFSFLFLFQSNQSDSALSQRRHSLLPQDKHISCHFLKRLGQQKKQKKKKKKSLTSTPYSASHPQSLRANESSIDRGQLSAIPCLKKGKTSNTTERNQQQRSNLKSPGGAYTISKSGMNFRIAASKCRGASDIDVTLYTRLEKSHSF
jgi:hypothetical protein